MIWWSIVSVADNGGPKLIRQQPLRDNQALEETELDPAAQGSSRAGSHQLLAALGENISCACKSARLRQQLLRDNRALEGGEK